MPSRVGLCWDGPAQAMPRQVGLCWPVPRRAQPGSAAPSGRRRAHGQEGGARGLTSPLPASPLPDGSARLPAARRRAEVSASGGQAQRGSHSRGQRGGAAPRPRPGSGGARTGRRGAAPGVQCAGRVARLGSACHGGVAGGVPAGGDRRESPQPRCARSRGTVPPAIPGPRSPSARLGSGDAFRPAVCSAPGLGQGGSGPRGGLGRGRSAASVGFGAVARSRPETGVSRIRVIPRERPVGRGAHPGQVRGCCSEGVCWKRFPVASGGVRAGTGTLRAQAHLNRGGVRGSRHPGDVLDGVCWGGEGWVDAQVGLCPSESSLRFGFTFSFPARPMLRGEEWLLPAREKSAAKYTKNLGKNPGQGLRSLRGEQGVATWFLASVGGYKWCKSWMLNGGHFSA